MDKQTLIIEVDIISPDATEEELSRMGSIGLGRIEGAYGNRDKFLGGARLYRKKPGERRKAIKRFDFRKHR